MSDEYLYEFCVSLIGVLECLLPVERLFNRGSVGQVEYNDTPNYAVHVPRVIVLHHVSTGAVNQVKLDEIFLIVQEAVAGAEFDSFVCAGLIKPFSFSEMPGYCSLTHSLGSH